MLIDDCLRLPKSDCVFAYFKNETLLVKFNRSRAFNTKSPEGLAFVILVFDFLQQIAS